MNDQEGVLSYMSRERDAQRRGLLRALAASYAYITSSTKDVAGWSPSVREQGCNVSQEIRKPGGRVLPLAQQLQHHSNAV